MPAGIYSAEDLGDGFIGEGNSHCQTVSKTNLEQINIKFLVMPQRDLVNL